MDYSRMLESHASHRADVTVGCVEVPLAEARNFGVLGTDEHGWVEAFAEKPANATALPGKPDLALASMGIYVFNTDFLVECLEADAADSSSTHDFGHSILPAIIGARSGVFAYSFRDMRTGAQGYWRDVGTVESYWQANMDLLAEEPRLDLSDDQWPIRTYQRQAPPPRFVANGVARDSMVSSGCLVAGEVRHSVLSTGCRIGGGSIVEDAVILPNVRIGRNCRISRAIIDTDCVVADGTVVRADLFAPVGSHVSPTGVVLFTSEEVIEPREVARSSSTVA
jgi:glucose-1-phosphate adenylyltransferase